MIQLYTLARIAPIVDPAGWECRLQFQPVAQPWEAKPVQTNPYAIPLIVSVLLSTLLAVLAWRRRPAPGAAMLALLMLALGAWSVAYIMELISSDLPTKLFWAKVQYIPFLAIPALWLVFVLQYSGREKALTRRRLALLTVIPLITLALVWTTERHGLIYNGVALVDMGAYTLLELSYGPFFWVQGIYSYLLFLFATAIVFLNFISGPRLQRSQSAALLIGALAPLVGNALYVAGATPFPNLDLAPMLFFVTGIAALWGLLRYRFLDLLPVARDALIEGMNDGVAVIDARGRVVDLNSAAHQMIGASWDTVLGAPAAVVLPGWSHLEARLGAAREVQSEIERQTGDASHYLELRVSPLIHKGDAFKGWLAVYRDVTASRRAEQADQQQRALLEGVRDAAATLTTTLSLDEVLDRILEQTKAVASHGMSNIMLIEEGWAYVARARGYSDTEILDGVARLRLNVAQTANLRWMVENRQPLAIDDTDLYEGWIHTFHFPWIRSYAGAPIFSKGQVIGFLNLNHLDPGFFDQGQAQALQTFANQAGVAIENARLYASLQEANARLRAALLARDAAIQNVSHELRTPLTILLGYIEFVESGEAGPVTEGQGEALRIMRQQGRRLVFMVNSLLMLQTFEQEPLPVEALDLRDWLPEVVESWRYLAEDANIRLRLHMAGQLPQVMGAANYLEMVIGNLIDNAVKFSPHGGEIRIAVQPDGARVVVSVSDEGVGIPQDQVESIFGRFYQVDGTSTRRFRGMGIGLALCQTIVAAHNGRIWAESPGPNQGSTIYFTLPALPAWPDG